ncbi:MAG TPA: bifunctional phosphopantothenoylcysteine decarboxylase/phosphopantothenate--cysteine ligase CoaBC [Halanaerobiales bacterium]|nr:bifunctional phosphopantothenoylcysteine decarboxylase/phosphopantothenate--cysteine ligase CoaBC [Halanaerobiales bacterium]
MSKNVLLGITGGIAAYKMVEVASQLYKKDYNVQVVMTKNASKFVSPLTFRSITGNPVKVDLFHDEGDYNVKHISLADNADICLIGPATANIIAKLAAGIADDLLSTTILATESKVILAPSMNAKMYNNPVLQDKLKYLSDKGYIIIEPETGNLACGYKGKGRLPEPDFLVEWVIKELTKKDLLEKRILITAGPTCEPMDPVRYLSNYSTGKMGYSLARAAVNRGAKVILVSGPTSLKPPVGVKTHYIQTAQELAENVEELKYDSDIIIMAAAVSDFRPAEYKDNKIKKGYLDYLSLELKSNPDIIANIGKSRKQGQLLVGFAVESEDILENARNKLIKKNLDLIIANDISSFGSDDNEITLITEDYIEEIPRMNKKQIADIIFDKIVELME